MHDNEKEESLNEFDEEENIAYVPLLFSSPPQKESNHPTNMGEEQRV